MIYLYTLILSPFRQMFGRGRTPSVRPSLLMIRIYSPIARISSALILCRVLTVVLSLWRRDHNHMDSYWLSTVDVPQSPIASGARGP